MTIDKKKIPPRTVCDPYDVYGVIQTILSLPNKPDLSKEHLWTVSLDMDQIILDLELVSICSYLDTASIPGEVFSIPLQKKSYGIILSPQ